MNKITPIVFFGLLLVSISRMVSAATWDPAVTMVYSEEMAPGVFVVLDADDPVKNENGQSAYTSSGFIIGEKGVLVVDTYVNARITGQLIALIRKETSLPILYAVNTSYHGDHMYGNYLFPNTLIIQHEATRAFIETKFEDDLQFMMNQFGAGKGMEDSIPRTGDIMMNDGMDMMRIDLGGRMVEIHRFGFGQTAGDLQVWLPEEKIMWIGNPVPAEAPITPWLTEGGHLDSLETMRKLVEFLPEDARVIPGHGRPFRMDYDRNGLTQIVDYLAILDKNVRESVEKDMSLTETIRAHQMRDHTASGYELFNWTHNQLNIPCVYKHYHERLGKGEDPGPSARHCFHVNTSDLEEQG